jgi:hypothetical protein
MNKILYLILLIGLMVTGCDNTQQNQIKNDSDDKTVKPVNDDIDVKTDTLDRGDIFVTSGPAGKMDQKEGRILMYAGSGKTMPIRMVDNVLLALMDSTGTTYRVKMNGAKPTLVLPDSDQVLNDGKMMFITDTGEMMEVKMLGEKIVVITARNTMLPLEKLE